MSYPSRRSRRRARRTGRLLACVPLVLALAAAGLVVAWPTIARDPGVGAVPGDDVRSPQERRYANAQAELAELRTRTGLLDPAGELRHARQDLVGLRARRARLVGPEVASTAVIDVMVAERTAEVTDLQEAVREDRRLTARVRAARAALGDAAPAPVPDRAGEQASGARSPLRWIGAAAIAAAGLLATAGLLRRRSLRHAYRPRRAGSFRPAVGSHGSPEDSYRWLHGQPIAPVPRVSQDITQLFAEPARRVPQVCSVPGVGAIGSPRIPA